MVRLLHGNLWYGNTADDSPFIQQEHTFQLAAKDAENCRLGEDLESLQVQLSILAPGGQSDIRMSVGRFNILYLALWESVPSNSSDTQLLLCLIQNII